MQAMSVVGLMLRLAVLGVSLLMNAVLLPLAVIRAVWRGGLGALLGLRRQVPLVGSLIAGHDATTAPAPEGMDGADGDDCAWGTHRFVTLSSGIRMHFVEAGNGGGGGSGARRDSASAARRRHKGRATSSEPGSASSGAGSSSSVDTKPLMLFVHGFPECWYAWRHQMAAFMDEFHCVAVDLRGCGLTDKPAARVLGLEQYTLDVLVHDLRALMTEHLGVSVDDADPRAHPSRKVVLVGHDWGAIVTWAFAARYPQYLAAAVPMNCPHPRAFISNMSLAQAKRSLYVILFQFPWLPEMLLSTGNFGFLRRAHRQTFVHTERANDADAEAFWWSGSRPGGLTAGLNYYRAFVQIGPSAEMNVALDTKVPAPVLLVWGEKDIALGIGLTIGHDRWARDCTLRRIADASHFVQQDTPDKVIAAMREFLEEVGAQPDWRTTTVE